MTTRPTRSSYSIKHSNGTIAIFDLPYYTAKAVCRRRADGSSPVRNG